MPTYHYECTNCLDIKDLILSVKEHSPILTIICDCSGDSEHRQVIVSAPLMKMGVGHAWNGAQAEVDKMKKKKRKYI